jgi:type IV pilus assembly protein PilB
MTSGVKEVVLKSGTPQELKRLAIAEGMMSLRQSALQKLRLGQTTVQEVLNSSIGDGT